MIFSAYTLYSRFKKSISHRWQKWPFHSSNSNNSSTSLIPLTPPFKGFVRFIRYVTLHSLRYTSFVSLCFIRFALLCFTSFTSLRSVRRCLTPLASLIPFASLRFTHSASLHSFRFTPLISFHSTHFTYFTLSGVASFHLWSFFIVSVWLVPLWDSTIRVVSHMKETNIFLMTIKSSESEFTSYNNITIQVSYLKYLLIKTSLFLSITV